MKSLPYLILFAALGLALFGSFREALFLSEIARCLPVLAALTSLAAIATSGPRVWRASLAVGLLGRPVPADVDAAQIARALTTQSNTWRNLALVLALLQLAEPLIASARGLAYAPAQMAHAISYAFVFGMLGLLVGEILLGRAARAAMAHANVPVAPASSLPLAFLALPALTLFLATYSL